MSLFPVWKKIVLGPPEMAQNGFSPYTLSQNAPRESIYLAFPVRKLSTQASVPGALEIFVFIQRDGLCFMSKYRLVSSVRSSCYLEVSSGLIIFFVAL